MVTLPGAKSRYETGELAGDFLAKAADAAANFACGLYKDFPGALINPVPVPVRDYGAGLMDSLCAKRPNGLPISSTPNFSGGQCPNVSYRVDYRRGTPTSTGGVSFQNFSATIVGQVLGLQRISNDPITQAANWVIAYQTPSGIQTQAAGLGIHPDASNVITAITRTDGLPDTCGNKAPGFPDSTIPPSRSGGNVTINKNDGTTFNIPIVYAPITPTLEITPRFNFDLGGINIQFDAGGVTFNNARNPSDPINRDNLPPGTGQTINNIGGNVTNLGNNIANLGDIVNNINTTVNDIKDDPCICPEFNPDEVVPEPKTEDDPKEQEDDPTIESVEITLTSVPRNARSQFGADAPDVVYAGWFEWKRGEFCFPREPIHFKQTIFKNMVSADGFAYTVYQGFRAKHTINRVPDEPA